MELIKKTCPKKGCGKVIEGTSESGVDYNMEVHLATQHQTKIKKNGERVEK